MDEKMMNFKAVFDKYSALGKARQEDVGHKESQVRDKLMEIVDAVGIDAALLRKGDKRNSPLKIPETSVDFLVDVLDWHTSPEAKALRKAKFLKVSADKKAWLVNGFIEYLEKAGYDAKVIAHQRQLMEYRMKCALQRNLNLLHTQLMSIYNHVANLRPLGASYFSHEDQILFADFAVKKVAELAEYLKDIAYYWDEVRGEEISELAMEESTNSSEVDIMERELRTVQVYRAVSKDQRYIELEKERDALIAEEDFIKKKKGRYQQIVDEIQKIANGYEQDFFGDIMPDEPEPHFALKHPHVAMAVAIAYKKEVDEDRKKILAQPLISEEEKERIRQCFIEKFGEDPVEFLKGAKEDA
ncbi:hypothetical protein [uncultured Selenomonas sp.]|uniref:hypothetical protein n=1 Tax=uncultured Selenomonas sp. TaxID=159275 RepID=UPI0028E88690|nr:hypothetical protein [uncultured Selenomonas sp.]